MCSRPRKKDEKNVSTPKKGANRKNELLIFKQVLSAEGMLYAYGP